MDLSGAEVIQGFGGDLTRGGEGLPLINDYELDQLLLLNPELLEDPLESMFVCRF